MSFIIVKRRGNNRTVYHYGGAGEPGRSYMELVCWGTDQRRAKKHPTRAAAETLLASHRQFTEARIREVPDVATAAP